MVTMIMKPTRIKQLKWYITEYSMKDILIWEHQCNINEYSMNRKPSDQCSWWYQLNMNEYISWKFDEI